MRRDAALIFFAALLFFSGSDALSEDELSPAGRYLKLEKLFYNYDRAMFGSRPYHERILRAFLSDIIYTEIETPPDFVLVTSGAMYDKTVRSKLEYRRWLEIRGKINRDSLKHTFSGDVDSDRGWRLTDIMFSVSGKITWARISRNTGGRSVELYFDEIIIKRYDGVKEK